MNQKDLHITIAAAPNVEFGNPRVLEHDLRLTKASILYADRVKLCSMTAWMATGFHLMSNAPMSMFQQFDIIMGLAPTIACINPGSIDLIEFQKIHQLLKKKTILLTRKERIKISNFKDFFPDVWLKLSTAFNEILRNFGFDEIENAANQGLLEIHPFSSLKGEDYSYEYLSIIEEILSNTDTHPMLDEQTNGLVRAALNEGKISVGKSSTRKGKQVGIVADLFDRLPVFDVKMDELLDLRSELQNPLIRFRAEMVKLGNDVESAAWDKDFPSDVQEAYQAKVEPALVEIEERLRSNAFSEFWSRRIVDKYGFIAGAVGTSVAMGATVAPLVGIATAIAAFGLFREAGLAELNEKIDEIERNGLYFYYRVKKHSNEE